MYPYTADRLVSLGRFSNWFSTTSLSTSESAGKWLNNCFLISFLLLHSLYPFFPSFSSICLSSWFNLMFCLILSPFLSLSLPFSLFLSFSLSLSLFVILYAHVRISPHILPILHSQQVGPHHHRCFALQHRRNPCWCLWDLCVLCTILCQ